MLRICSFFASQCCIPRCRLLSRAMAKPFWKECAVWVFSVFLYDEWMKRRDCRVGNESFAVEPQWLKSSQFTRRETITAVHSFQSQMEFCFPLAPRLSHSKSALETKHPSPASPPPPSLIRTKSLRNWLLLNHFGVVVLPHCQPCNPFHFNSIAKPNPNRSILRKHKRHPRKPTSVGSSHQLEQHFLSPCLSDNPGSIPGEDIFFLIAAMRKLTKTHSYTPW